MEFSDEELPKLFIMDPRNGLLRLKKYHYYEDARSITVDDIKFHVTEFYNGKLYPYVSSEPIPETNDRPLKVFVGKNYRKEVL